MMNYKEYNDSIIKDTNEKSKSKKRLLKSSKMIGNVNSNEVDKQKEKLEKEEARREFIQKNMNKFVNGASEYE